MKKISQAALLALGISLEACAPYEWSDAPNEEEAETMNKAIDQYNLATPLACDLVEKSTIPLLDKYGNDDSGNEQVAEDLKEKNELLNWFWESDRIRVYNLEDYQKARKNSEITPGGLYDPNLGQEERNDWIYINREFLYDVEVYAHEMGHLYYMGPDHGHSKTVTDYVKDKENDEERSEPGIMLEYAIEHQDPAYQDGALMNEVREFIWELNPYSIMEREVEIIMEEVERGYISPQQGYDRLYKKLSSGREDFFQQRIDYHISHGSGLWPLELTESEILEVVLDSPEMQEWYNQMKDSLLNEYTSEFYDHAIETKEEQGQEHQERQVTDLDGYRSRKLR